MKTALRRSLERFGWQALGFVLGACVLGLSLFFWGQHIERRINRVVVERQHDHRAIKRIVRKLEGGDASQPAQHAGQQPGPAQAGGKGAHKGGKKPPKSPKPPPAPAPTPTPAPAAPPAPEPSPGNSGDTPAAENGTAGVKACVDLVVSTCTEVDVPKLLP